MPPPAMAMVDTTLAGQHAPECASAPTLRKAPFWRKLVAFSGPGYLVAVGYMDPGNWATGIAAGSAFGYRLLSVVVIANILAMFLQALSAKLGIVTGLDLAQACRARYSPPVRLLLWLLCEIAIVACDLAEVLGTAIALQLLFGVPLLWGVALTILDVMIVLGLQRRGMRYLEAFIVALIAMIGACFAIELWLAGPNWLGVGRGIVPSPGIMTDPAMLYLAMGIVGATVMPHNLYLHSAMVQTRRIGPGALCDKKESHKALGSLFSRDFKRKPGSRFFASRSSIKDKREAIRFATLDSSFALVLAVLVNGAIVILAAAAFHTHGHSRVTGIADAYRLLSPVLGVGLASTVFAVALLASGQSSTITGTLAGQIVMEGFTTMRMSPWLRRSVSRLLAIVPAFVVIYSYGPGATGRLLIASQVVLSLQLPFAVVPLIRLTGDRALMGVFANGFAVRWMAAALAAVLIGLNLILLAGLW